MGRDCRGEGTGLYVGVGGDKTGAKKLGAKGFFKRSNRGFFGGGAGDEFVGAWQGGGGGGVRGPLGGTRGGASGKPGLGAQKKRGGVRHRGFFSWAGERGGNCGSGAAKGGGDGGAIYFQVFSKRFCSSPPGKGHQRQGQQRGGYGEQSLSSPTQKAKAKNHGRCFTAGQGGAASFFYHGQSSAARD